MDDTASERLPQTMLTKASAGGFQKGSNIVDEGRDELSFYEITVQIMPMKRKYNTL